MAEPGSNMYLIFTLTCKWLRNLNLVLMSLGFNVDHNTLSIVHTQQTFHEIVICPLPNVKIGAEDSSLAA